MLSCALALYVGAIGLSDNVPTAVEQQVCMAGKRLLQFIAARYCRITGYCATVLAAKAQPSGVARC